MADREPMTVAELILELLTMDGDMEVEIMLHTRSAGVEKGHVKSVLSIPATYLGDRQAARLMCNDIELSKRLTLLNRRKR